METESNSRRVTSILRWLATAVGDEALAYLLGCGSAEIAALVFGETQPSEAQRETINTLSLLRQHMPPELDEDSINEAVRAWLMQVSPADRTIAVQIHEHGSGADAIPAADNDLDARLSRWQLTSTRASSSRLIPGCLR
jgi:hypothetical protein